MFNQTGKTKCLIMTLSVSRFNPRMRPSSSFGSHYLAAGGGELLTCPMCCSSSVRAAGRVQRESAPNEDLYHMNMTGGRDPGRPPTTSRRERVWTKTDRAGILGVYVFPGSITGVSLLRSCFPWPRLAIHDGFANDEVSLETLE